MQVVLLLVVLMISACVQPPAQVFDYGDHFYGKYGSIKLNIPEKPRLLAKANLRKNQGKIVVRKGDTLIGIAKRLSISTQDIIRRNHLKPPYRLQAGQVLQITGRQTVTQAQPGITKSRILKKPIRSPKQVKPEVQKPDTDIIPMEFKPLKGTGGQFIYPVKGKLIARFGVQEGEVRNDGINIAATVGSSIRAAAAGEVVYVGNELKGYGNLIILQHQGGWLTAYAHASETLVSSGDIVSQGEVIGRVGMTGNVSRPQLHFAVRKGKKAVDPLKYL